MELLHTLLFFVIAIVFLVSLHEFGHYIVARWCGVKVRCFSVGFGRPFLKKRVGDTEWCVAPIPLGGYVKLLDTREGDVVPDEWSFAFDQQHPGKKMLIVAAGPVVNLLLAGILYAVSFNAGVNETRPLVGEVWPGSVAAQAGFAAGDSIEAVNGEATANFSEASIKLLAAARSGSVKVTVTTENGDKALRVLNESETLKSIGKADSVAELGISPVRHTRTISQVAPNSAAQKAGLMVGDTIISLDNQPVKHWLDFASTIRSKAGAIIRIGYLRHGEEATTEARLDSVMLENHTIIGRLGIATSLDSAWSKALESRYKPGHLEALKMGFSRAGSHIALTVNFIGRLISGNAALSNISGPVMIADVAGQAAQLGWQSYVEFLAILSISLGVMNLLPIPVLDGGHLVYHALEWLKGSPLSSAFQMAGTMIGVAFMLFVMLLTFYNDITRLFG